MEDPYDPDAPWTTLMINGRAIQVRMNRGLHFSEMQRRRKLELAEKMRKVPGLNSESKHIRKRKSLPKTRPFRRHSSTQIGLLFKLTQEARAINPRWIST